jgi:hypothetical protein
MSPPELRVGWADQNSMIALSSQLSAIRKTKALTAENAAIFPEIAKKIVLVDSDAERRRTTRHYHLRLPKYLRTPIAL